MQRQYRSGIFIVDFYCNSHLFFVVILLTLNRQTFTGYLFYRSKVCSLKFAVFGNKHPSLSPIYEKYTVKKWKSYGISQSFENIFLE